MITVKKVDNTTFRVVVEDRSMTSHMVSLSKTYYEKITNKAISQELLIEKSFEFLLEREPNTSILRSFELSVIGRYFPEYEETIKTQI
jgi:hypothetical protein